MPRFKNRTIRKNVGRAANHHSRSPHRQLRTEALEARRLMAVDVCDIQVFETLSPHAPIDTSAAVPDDLYPSVNSLRAIDLPGLGNDIFDEEGPYTPDPPPPLDNSGASIELVGRQLIVKGTNNADTIEIEEIVTPNSPTFIRATITSWNGDVVLTDQFAAPFVERVAVFGGRLGDTITNNTSITSSLYGEGGRDILRGGRTDDFLIGGDDDDTYVFVGAAKLGDDVIIDVHGRRDHIDFGGLGEGVQLDLRERGVKQQVNSLLSLTLNEGPDTIEDITGTSFDDELRGSSTVTGDPDVPVRVNHLRGRGGNDLLFGFSGSDLLIGGGGDDTIYAGSGNDRIEGGLGDDALYGGTGADVYIYAGEFALGIDDIVDAASQSNSFDFTELGQRVEVDLRQNGWQSFNSLVTVNLINTGSIQNVQGTAFDDLLFGNQDDNWLAGNGGNDRVYGYAGDDTLLGGDGHDTLYGGLDNDGIYAGDGDDVVRGEEGNDGVYGGLGTNHVYGGAGADRALHQGNGAVNFTDRTAQDVLINFVNRGQGDIYPWYDVLNSGEYYAGAWTDEDVQRVDQALKNMQELTGNTTLLGTHDGGPLEFSRNGAYKSGSRLSGLYVPGWEPTIDGGNVRLTDFAFSQGVDWTEYVVYHEMAHGWKGKTDFWGEFSAVGGAEYATDYAQTNDNEDWAESVATYIGNEFGNVFSEDQIGNIPRKADIIRRWIESISDAANPRVTLTTGSSTGTAFGDSSTTTDNPTTGSNVTNPIAGDKETTRSFDGNEDSLGNQWLTDAAAVEKLYQQVLGRAPDETGLKYHVEQLGQSAALSTVAAGIFESPERLDPIIGQMYSDFLFREAEPAGMAFYREMWQRDGGPQNVRASIISSPEFYQSAGGTDAGWVTELYSRLLGRTATEEESAFHVDRLASGVSRRDLVLGFLESSENHHNLVDAWHMQYLNRLPNKRELDVLLSRMALGTTDRDIQIAIIDSPEYASVPL